MMRERIYFKDKDGNFCSRKQFIASGPSLELCSVTTDATLAETVLQELESVNIDFVRAFINAPMVDQVFWSPDIEDGTSIRLVIAETGYIEDLSDENEYGWSPQWTDTVSKSIWIERFEKELMKRINEQKRIVDALNLVYVEEEN